MFPSSEPQPLHFIAREHGVPSVKLRHRQGRFVSLVLASALKPRPEINQSDDTKFKITHWLGLYEGYLYLNFPRSYERYSRVLTRFYTHFPGKHRTFDYLRPDFESYKNDRLKEGASPKTLQIELSVLPPG